MTNRRVRCRLAELNETVLLVLGTPQAKYKKELSIMHPELIGCVALSYTLTDVLVLTNAFLDFIH